MRKILIVTSLVALGACSSGEVNDTLHADATPSNIQMETAKYFETSRSRVRIGSLKQGILGTSYRAKVAGSIYDCKYFKKAVTCSRS